MTMTTSGFHQLALAEAVLRRHLPAIAGSRRWVEAGVLMGYGPSVTDGFRISADYVDKILKGVKPADLASGSANTSSAISNDTL